MRTWHKEPLAHFLIIGVLIFVLYSVVNEGEDTLLENRIVISTADIERISTGWSAKWNRPPTETELQGLVESYIREEVYYREALALGLDRNDTILRRRLMQKMEFLSNDLADINTPDEATLNEFFLDHRDVYELPARATFTHVYFSLDKRGEKAIEDAKRILAELRTASPPILRASERGDTLMLQHDFVQEIPFEVSRLFGNSFAGRLFQLDTNSWQGPIESGYGFHLVRISERIDPRMPELASVIDKVRTDWMYKQRQRTNEEIYRRFKERYEIIVEELPEQPGMAKTGSSDKEVS